jgi:hypothetical protein
MRPAVRSLVVAWFLLVLLLAANHKFISTPGTPPLAVGLAFLVPILLFLAAVRLSPGFHDYVLKINSVFLAALHGWRFIGLGFIMAYCEHLLDGSFAWPAGLGDLTAGIFAPWIVLRLATDKSFIRNPLFLAWNIFGITDFVVAVATGTIDQGVLPAFKPAIVSSLMQRLPFVLIPCFFVPWLLITHIIMLMQRRRV